MLNKALKQQLVGIGSISKAIKLAILVDSI